MAQLSITFLGTGTSVGIPLIGCRCAVCRSEDPRDKRLRSSVLLRWPGGAVVVDTGPDFRTQCLRAGLEDLDAAIYTHAHTDHVAGFDDLRGFCIAREGQMPIYASATTLTSLEGMFHFAFDLAKQRHGYTRPDPRIIEGPFSIGDLTVEPFELPHGSVTSLGFVFSLHGRRLFGYFSDCKTLPPEAIDAVRGINLLVLGAVRRTPLVAHLHLDAAVELAQAAGAERTYLTHLCHELGHAETEAQLPPSVRIAFDNLTLQIPIPD